MGSSDSSYSSPRSRLGRLIRTMKTGLAMRLLGQRVTFEDRGGREIRQFPTGTFTVRRAHGVERWHAHR